MALSSKQLQAQATRQKIIDVSGELIAGRGYNNVSVDDIVAECGVAKGTFYNHFASKEELLCQLSFSPYEQMQRHAGERLGSPLRQQLEGFIREWCESLEKTGLNMSDLSFRRYNITGSRSDIGGAESRIDIGLQIIRSCFEDALKTGELAAEAPVEALSSTIMFAMQGTTMYLAKHKDFQPMDWCRGFLPLVLDDLVGPYLA